MSRPEFHIEVIHGPNLNLLGSREPDLYGTITLDRLDALVAERARALGVGVTSFQANGEGALVERIHWAGAHADGIVINAAAYTHTSVALLDALRAVGLPAVEVHLTNPFAREAFRQRSLIAPAVVGVVAGFGVYSYLLGLDAVVNHLRERAHGRREE